jgi:SAM-dependent methyltransferase
MHEAYSKAHSEIDNSLTNGGMCLDCGAGHGHRFRQLNREIGLDSGHYFGIEWDEKKVEIARDDGINVVAGDLNRGIEHPDNTFRCIFGLSVLEHLLYPCRFLRECFRCLESGGQLVLLTPNISTYFTAALIIAGRMPSSGPHVDSELLLSKEELFKVSDDAIHFDAESDTPVHRHLVVFSYRVLKTYLEMLGLESIRGYGYGLYPFPNFIQPFLERIDPYHCHQMVFVATKPATV